MIKTVSIQVKLKTLIILFPEWVLVIKWKFFSRLIYVNIVHLKPNNNGIK